jgi:hypothetical protein
LDGNVQEFITYNPRADQNKIRDQAANIALEYEEGLQRRRAAKEQQCCLVSQIGHISASNLQTRPPLIHPLRLRPLGSVSNPLTRPPFILPLRLCPLCFYPSDSAPSALGEGGKQCGKVTLLHHSPPHPELIINQQETVRCIKERSVLKRIKAPQLYARCAHHYFYKGCAESGV